MTEIDITSKERELYPVLESMNFPHRTQHGGEHLLGLRFKVKLPIPATAFSATGAARLEARELLVPMGNEH